MTKAGAYVHIPFCRKKCDYCAFTSAVGEVSNEYINALVDEITRSKHTDLVFDTLFIGGGTPSLLPDGDTAKIIDAIRARFHTDFREITVECNPESLTDKKLYELKSVGVNRISIGVQSLDDSALKTIGRIHTAGEALGALERTLKLFDNVSVDLMLGLPARRNINCELDALLSYPIKHLSAYMLSVEDGTPLSSSVKACKVIIPDEDVAVTEYDAVLAACAKVGLIRYEVSNFAVPGAECLHNLKYWRRQPYLGFGVAAHSQVGDSRFFNVGDTSRYVGGDTLGGVDKVDEKEAMFETVMLGLRLDEGVSRAEFLNRFGVDLCAHYSNNIARVRDALSIDDERVKVKPEYTCVLNSILVEFMD